MPLIHPDHSPEGPSEARGWVQAVLQLTPNGPRAAVGCRSPSFRSSLTP